jgi:N-acetylglucosamine-6-phosphate deacetylase
MMVRLLFLYSLLLIINKICVSQEMHLSGWDVNDKDYLSVFITDGKISRIEKELPPSVQETRTYISAGLIDTQVNGYASVSFSADDLTIDGIKKVVKILFREGVTTFFPTLISGQPDITRKNLGILAEAAKDPFLAHILPGFFLEGPYISKEDGFRGAHEKEWVRPPDWEEFLSFYHAADGKIIQVGIAPELPGAIDFIKKATGLGIIVSLAHHNANAETINEAILAGAKVSTHLGNGCANTIHRHDNPIWPQLADDRLVASIIADGQHLNPSELSVFFRVKGVNRLMLVSDATELAGMPSGEYNWNGHKVIKTNEGRLVYPEQNVLAGASFPVKNGVMNMIRQAGCSLESAIRMATETPSEVYGLKDRGKLEAGRSADMVLFSIKSNELRIEKTIFEGVIVYSGPD